MDVAKLPFQIKTLQRAETPDKYNIYRAGLEWDLIEPIVIENREDIHSESKWHNHTLTLMQGATRRMC